MAQPSWPAERFRDVLDRIIERSGRNQTALAALVPMDPSQFSRWRSGMSRPKYESLSAFADAVSTEFPKLGIAKQEILAAGGYEDVLVQPETVRATGTAHDAAASAVGDKSWFLHNPPAEMRLGVDWDTLSDPEKWAYHMPGLSLKNRSVMAGTVRALMDADAEADKYVTQALDAEQRWDQRPNSA